MATPKLNSKSPTIRRILREAQELSASPSADFAASPLETDLFEWHFTLRGPPNSVYADGLYHGRIVLPPTYPLRPPSFRFVTPSGRFETNREICLSISGHHEETWQPAWGVRTALVALRSFMETDPRGQLGGLDASDTVRRRLAAESTRFRCPACSRTNAEIIKESAEEEARLRAEQEEEGQASSSAAPEVVPAELKLVFRDQLEQQQQQQPKTEASGTGDSTGPTPSAAPDTTSTLVQPPPPQQQQQQQQQPLQPVQQLQQQPQMPQLYAASSSSSSSSAFAPPPAAAPAQAPVPAPTRTIRPSAAAAAAPGAVAAPPPPQPAITSAPALPQPLQAPQAPSIRQRQQPQNQLNQQPVYAQPVPARRRPSDDAVPLWVDRALVILFVVLIGMLLRMMING